MVGRLDRVPLDTGGESGWVLQSAAERKERFSHAAAEALHQVQAAEAVLYVLR